MTSRDGGRAALDPSRADLDIAVPHAERRAMLTTGTGGPLTLARGLVAGDPAELVGDRARLELRRDEASTLALELRDWVPPETGHDSPPPPTAQAWRFRVVGDGVELSAEVTKIRHARSPLAEATRYWKLTGDGKTWFYADNGAVTGKRNRDRSFHLWREQPRGAPLVVVTFVDVRKRNVEDVVSGRGEISATGAATSLDVELAVLLSVGGFNRELVGRNTQLRRIRRFLVEQAIDNLLDDEVNEPDLDALELGP